MIFYPVIRRECCLGITHNSNLIYNVVRKNAVFQNPGNAHEGQKGKGGKPYIEHLAYVSEHVESKAEKLLRCCMM